MIRIPHFKLPVGGTPAWELPVQDSDDNGKASGLKSIADSFIILQSLRQSREKWITLTFPKFSSKARGNKAADTVPPAHTIQTRGKCDVEIGPHIFHDTIFFVVHYLPPQAPPAPRPAYLYQPPGSAGGSWQATTPYGGAYTPYGQRPGDKYVPPVTKEAITPQATSKPLLSSLTSSVSITPSLINQVNSAASSNPTLANLLQLAAAGKASPEQLKTLGLLIQSLANPSIESINASTHLQATQNSLLGSSSLSRSASGPAPSASTYGSYSPVKPFDLVIEFAENPSERWIFPRGHAVCERLLDSTSTDAAYDILISTFVPFAASVSTIDSTPAGPEGVLSRQDGSPQLVTFRLKKAPLAVWDTVSRWAGGEDVTKENRKILEALTSPERVYLGHQISEGALRTQLQSSVAPSFATKSIRPGQDNATRPKRKATPRKPSAVGTSDSANPTPKRKRPSQAKITAPLPQISCFTCGQTDVPLIMGGRFCRPCVDSGKAVTDIPKVALTPSLPVAGTNNQDPARPTVASASSQLTDSTPSTHPPQNPQGSQQPSSENK